MSVETDLLTGIAQRLHDRSAATYRPSGGYLPTETAVVFGGLPTAPDKAISLTLYTAVDAQVENRSAFRVQARIRGAAGNTLSPGDIASAVFDALHGIEGVDFGSVTVISSSRVVVSPQGIDASKRTERADSYEFVCNLPTTPARPE